MLHLIVSISTSAVSAFHYVRFLYSLQQWGKWWSSMIMENFFFLILVISTYSFLFHKVEKKRREKFISAVGCLNVTQNLFNLLILFFAPLLPPLRSYSGKVLFSELCKLVLLLLLLLILTCFKQVKKSVVENSFFPSGILMTIFLFFSSSYL